MNSILYCQSISPILSSLFLNQALKKVLPFLLPAITVSDLDFFSGIGIFLLMGPGEVTGFAPGEETKRQINNKGRY